MGSGAEFPGDQIDEFDIPDKRGLELPVGIVKRRDNRIRVLSVLFMQWEICRAALRQHSGDAQHATGGFSQIERRLDELRGDSP